MGDLSEARANMAVIILLKIGNCFPIDFAFSKISCFSLRFYHFEHKYIYMYRYVCMYVILQYLREYCLQVYVFKGMYFYSI